MIDSRLNNSIRLVMTSLGPEIIDNNLNPVHLAVATRGYWIQSRFLQIPDRYGYFSPGPPRLQVYEGNDFIRWTLALSITFTIGMFAVLIGKLAGKPVILLTISMIAMMLGLVAYGWISMCYDCARASDYNWGDWKVHME